MEIIEIKTLIDITKTRVIRQNQGSQLAYDQNKNFTTLMQCIELRSVVSYNLSPAHEIIDVKSLNFGTAFKGKHAVWTFRFSPDRMGAYVSDTDGEIGALVNDLHGVPVIKNLTETINIEKAIFNLTDQQCKNVTVRVLSDLV